MSISFNPVLTILDKILEPREAEKAMALIPMDELKSAFTDIYLHQQDRFKNIFSQNHFTVRKMIMLDAIKYEPQMVKVLLPIIIDMGMKKMDWFNYILRDGDHVTRPYFLEAYKNLTQIQHDYFMNFYHQKLKNSDDPLGYLIMFCNDEPFLTYQMLFHPDGAFLREGTLDRSQCDYLLGIWNDYHGRRVLLAVGGAQPENDAEYAWLAEYFITGEAPSQDIQQFNEVALHL